MGILDSLLEEIGTTDLTQQVHEICDKIFEEEKEKIEYIEYLVTGPNIFLCLEVPGRHTKEIAFLTLEREYEEIYIAALWTFRKTETYINDVVVMKPDDPPKKQKTWTINENQAKKILTEYAKIVKTLRGE